MRKFKLEFGILVLASIIALSLAVGELIHDYEILNGRGVGGGGGGRNILNHQESRILSKYRTPMHKALFTQRGYIQFLRWELPVPEIKEFTFCLWVKSTNLTYSHSIFSYSKNEEKRLVRSWISPFGRSIHLEIGEIEIMEYPTNLQEHRWYHICQSWDNQIGLYGLWINGKKEIEGYADQLIGHVIPSKGDIVVGQEYTDFDKGFEEGIEGAVVGFNLVLSSAFDRSKSFLPRLNHREEENVRSSYLPFSFGENQVPQIFGLNDGIKSAPAHLDLGIEIHPGIPLRRSDENIQKFIPGESGNRQGNKIFNEKREGAFESTLKEYLGDESVFGNSAGFQKRGIAVKFVHKTKRDTRSSIDGMRTTRIRRRGGSNTSSLGLQLVDLTYNHCEIGRGSPFIGGSRMLISWTRTPVKVFGGAIIKDAKNSCGDF